MRWVKKVKPISESASSANHINCTLYPLHLCTTLTASSEWKVKGSLGSILNRCNNTELWVTCTATSLNLVPITLNPHITTLGLHNSQVIVKTLTTLNTHQVPKPRLSTFDFYSHSLRPTWGLKTQNVNPKTISKWFQFKFFGLAWNVKNLDKQWVCLEDMELSFLVSLKIWSSDRDLHRQTLAQLRDTL